MKKNILLSKVRDGIPVTVNNGPDATSAASPDGGNCGGDDGCPAVGIDPTEQFLRIIAQKTSDSEKQQFEKDTGARVGKNEEMFDVPLALIEKAGFTRK